MFLSAVTFAKSKSKTILVKMLSQAGTGYSFNTKRSRLREKLTLLHYDPIECSGTVDCLAFCPPPEYPAGQNDDVRLGACPIAQVKTKVLFVEQKKIRSL